MAGLLRRLVLITRPNGDVCAPSLALVRKLKDLRLLHRLDSVSRERPCWTHRSAFLMQTDPVSRLSNVEGNHERIVEILKGER